MSCNASLLSSVLASKGAQRAMTSLKLMKILRKPSWADLHPLFVLCQNLQPHSNIRNFGVLVTDFSFSNVRETVMVDNHPQPSDFGLDMSKSGSLTRLPPAGTTSVAFGQGERALQTHRRQR